MVEVMVYRGRGISAEEIEWLRDLIGRHPEASRRRLSQLVCEAWEWRQPNGAPREMVCRGLMLALHRGGHIELPPRKVSPPNPLAQRRRAPARIELDRSPICRALDRLRPLGFRQVRRSGQERLYNGLVEAHHYLGYTQPVGEHLKYLVYSAERPVACFGWSSAPWHMGPRDRYIGWGPAVRRRNLHLLAYNTRFLILPWVKVPHLASHLLGQMARRVSADWQALYAHPIYYLETFVDTERFAGTCYRAANWVWLGRTTGRGIQDKAHKVTRSKKEVLGYGLGRAFRERLCEVGA
jgi:Druantia protein DruA